MTTYSITLDDVDLELLPWPSYSHNNFLKKEIYEFQVMKTGSGDASPPPILYTCHLCAIEVPAAFASEHAASRKHQANVRIASVAAERMRAFISALPPPHAAQTSAHFCAYCSIEMNEEHEKTNEHRVAVMLDDLLWDLMKAYVKDHETKLHEILSNEIYNKSKVNYKEYDVNFKHVDKNSENNNDMAINNNQPTELVEEKIKQNDDQAEKNVVINYDLEKKSNNNVTVNNTDNINSSTDHTENAEPILNVKGNNTDNKNLSTDHTENAKPILKRHNKHYGEELHKMLNDKDVFEYKEIIKISIKFNDNIINNIDSDHYHSYVREHEDGNLNCILCDCVFNDGDSEAHKYELEHMRRVVNLGKDGHYIREINEFYSHCILCNLKIENINLVTHIQSATHSVKEYLYTNTRSGNLKQNSEMEVNDVELKENNETLEPNDNIETYRDNKEPNDNLNYSGDEELKVNLEACYENAGTNMNDSSEDDSEYGYPITYLEHLEQFFDNEESSTSIYDSNNFITTITDSSKKSSQNEESRDNLDDNCGNEERLDKLEKLNEEEELTNNITNITLCTKNNTTKCNFKNYSQKYGEELRKYIDDNDSFEFEETYIMVEIKTKDNILKTYSDRFHSYNRFIDKGTIECLVCDCTFKDENGQEHKYNLKHISKIANLGRDGHYIREIDETYSHCILCNLKIENIHVTAHEEIFSHKFGKGLFTRSAAKKNNADVTTAREDTIIQHSPPVTDLPIKNCESICDPENNDADQEIKVESSPINNTGTNNLKCNPATDKKDPNMINDVKGNNDTNLVELTSAVKIETEKHIANEKNITDYGDELRKLIDTKCDFEYNERSNVIRIKRDDNIISIYNDHFHSFDRTYYSRRLKCIVCDCILKFEDAEEHKYDLKHMSRIINLGNDQNYVRKIDESYSHCILCNMKIKNGILDTHKKLLLHTIKKDLYTSKTVNIKPEVTTAESENEIPRDQEVKTAEGVDRVSYEKNKSNKSNEPVATVKAIDIIVGTKTEYPYEIAANGNLRCVVCDCQVPNVVWNREEHVKGLRHRNMVWYRYA